MKRLEIIAPGEAYIHLRVEDQEAVTALDNFRAGQARLMVETVGGTGPFSEPARIVHLNAANILSMEAVDLTASHW